HRHALHAATAYAQHRRGVRAGAVVDERVVGHHQRLVAPAGEDGGGDRHVGTHEVHGRVDAKAHVDGAAGGVDAGRHVVHRGPERAVGERIGDAGGRLADLEQTEVLLVQRQQDLAGCVAGDLEHDVAGIDRVAGLDVAYEH